MASPRRLERLQAQIVRETARILQRGLNDPRIGPCAITRSKLSRDTRYCTIYVDPRGDDSERRTTLRGLVSALPVLQGKLGDALTMRFLPQFKIEIDEQIEKTRKMNDLFRQIAEEREAKKACQNDTENEPACQDDKDS